MGDDIKAKIAEPVSDPDVMQKHVKAKEGMPSLVTKFQYPAEFDTTKLGAKVVDLLMSATEAPGFLNAEIIPPEHADVHEWLLIQRFRSSEQTDAWRAAPSRLAAAQSVAASLPGVTVSDDVSTYAPRGNVVTAIVTDVNREWKPPTSNGKLKCRRRRRTLLVTAEPTCSRPFWAASTRNGPHFCASTHQSRWKNGSIQIRATRSLTRATRLSKK